MADDITEVFTTKVTKYTKAVPVSHLLRLCRIVVRGEFVSRCFDLVIFVLFVVKQNLLPRWESG